MDIEEPGHLARRAAVHAALGDPARLAAVDLLRLGDLAPSEIGTVLGLSSNLLAHHLRVLEDAGVAVRRRSQGDGRRTYVSLVPGGLDGVAAPAVAPASDLLRGADRLVFVCTANSARSQLATALSRRALTVPVASAGTHPAAAVAPGARAAARRHRLRLTDATPRHLDDVVRDGDLLITVCDSAHEELGGRDAVHWAVPDPVPAGDAAAFDDTVADLTRRLTILARTLTPAS